MSPRPLLIICGPTATGKTNLALQLASVFNGELVSCDSRQVYCHMNIVTGKDIPDKFKFQNSKFKYSPLRIGYYHQDRGVKIWGYDLVDPDQQFNLHLYLEFACRIINRVWSEKKLPIIVGGNGFYLHSLLHPPQTLGIGPNQNLRNRLSALSPARLFQLLKEKSPDQALKLTESDQNNPHRLIRAIEIATQLQPTSSISPTLTSFINQIGQVQPLLIGLNYNQRQTLYQQIDDRVYQRLTHPRFVNEVNYLLDHDYLPFAPSQTIGYQQLISWMGGEINLQSALSQWQYAEHRYARRQLTWFKKHPHTNWYDVTQTHWQTAVVKQVKQWYTGRQRGHETFDRRQPTFDIKQ